MARHNEIGKIGEDIADDFLRQKGFQIVQRNYRQPFGEIDLIVKDGEGKLRFVEVKSVSWETGTSIVSHGTYQPEENVHTRKVKSLMRTIDAYLVSHGTDQDWQFDILAVFVDTKNKTAKVRHLKDVVLGT